METHSLEGRVTLLAGSFCGVTGASPTRPLRVSIKLGTFSRGISTEDAEDDGEDEWSTLYIGENCEGTRGW
jgi:hypothetical protein